MTKKKQAVLIPQKDFERYKRTTEMSELFAKMKAQEPDKSNNLLYTYIGAQYDCSITAVRKAIEKSQDAQLVTVETL